MEIKVAEYKDYERIAQLVGVHADIGSYITVAFFKMITYGKRCFGGQICYLADSFD